VAGPRLAVLADDLTGALASASRLRRAGWRPAVRWRAEDLPERADAICVDMRTRDRGVDRGARVRAWARGLRERDCDRYELRIDSTLRGQPAEELDALVAGADLDAPWLLAVPAFPAAGRVTRAGRQRLEGAAPDALDVDVAATVFPGREVRRLTIADVEGDSSAAFEAMDLAAGRGVRHFVADATAEGHLERIAALTRVVEAAGVPLVTVSPGAWLRFLAPPLPDRFALVVVATGSEPTRDQLAVLHDAGAGAGAGLPGPLLPSTPASASAIPVDELAGATVVVETATAAAPHDDLAEAAARAAADLLGRATAAGRACQGVVVSGGHAAACLVDALGAHALAVEGEVAPLCSRATLVGGRFDGLPLVAKGGLVGGPATLVELAAGLWGER
jgi:uncharacterized protein YgbK (DUF1537 family)